jgi:hypothetical protein
MAQPERTGICRVWSAAEDLRLSLPALVTGAGKTASRFSGVDARLRRKVNQPIGYFEGVEEPPESNGIAVLNDASTLSFT